MLIAIFISIYLAFSAMWGGGADQFGELMSKHAKDQIKIFVNDSSQRALALDQLSVLNKNIDAVNKLIEQDMKKFTKLVEDYNSTQDDFDQLLASASVKNSSICYGAADRRCCLIYNPMNGPPSLQARRQICRKRKNKRFYNP